MQAPSVQGLRLQEQGAMKIMSSTKRPYELVQEFTADKLMTYDTKFEVTKLVEAVIYYERERCAKIVDSWVEAHLDWVGGEIDPIKLLRDVASQVRGQR